MKARAMRHGILALLLVVLITVVPPLRAQEPASDPVLDLMAQMSPEAKVGQLVLVTFPGTELTDESEILTLIRNYQVGGVLLRPGNGNFGPSGISATDMVSMTTRLQTVAWESAFPTSAAPPDEEIVQSSTPFIPLLIAIQASDTGLAPFSYISGTTRLPTPLSLGATWNPALSKATGDVLGRELVALGINVYLGPDLDVLYTPRPGDPADLSTRVFGGDPFWVGEMGTAYIEGLHTGSEGRLLVVPRHLPGLGSADRPLENEVPTVQKPLEQLKQIELVPFFAASKELPGALRAADGFLVTHIRYRGFQGNNIRQTTRPISLDASALQLVTSLEEVAPWREAGGVLIADNLGMQSIYRFYDPRGLTFNPRRVTLDALGAGNDLLILDRFGSVDDWGVHFTNIRDTLSYMASRYNDDPAIRAVVDAAVYRILAMKLRVQPQFSIDEVTRDPDVAEDTLGEGELVTAQVAMNALTLVFPLQDDLLPSPPQNGESIVIIADEREANAGDGTDPVLLLTQESLVDALQRFYGPDGTGIIDRGAVQSFSFDELSVALDSTDDPDLPAEALAVFSALRRASWIVFATTGLDASVPSSMTLKRFLASEANVLEARIAVLAFGAPYDLDSTEVSKLAAYYALYSTGDAFVEAGVRALFGGLAAPGDSPVDVPALNYTIFQQTMPKQEQTISLFVVDDHGEELTATAKSDIRNGDVINLRTGVILDRNDHVVPDGTQVQFTLNYPQDSNQRRIVADTLDGIAATSVTLDRVGQLDITVQAEPAVSSVRLELTIRDDGVTITEVEPTSTPRPTETPSPTPTPDPTPTPSVPPAKTDDLPDHLTLPTPSRGRLIRWALVSTAGIFMVAFVWARGRPLTPDIAARVALWSAVGSLAGYSMFMVLARWLMPVLRYVLVGREYLAAVTALGVGSIALAIAFWQVSDRLAELTVEADPHHSNIESYSRSRS